MRRSLAVAAMSLLASAVGAGVAAVDGVAAASCGSTVVVSGPHNGKLVLLPAAAKVTVGDCLAFTNSTTTLVNIVITKAGQTVYRASLAHGTTTAVKASYAPKTAGRATIAAGSHVLLLRMTGSGSATVAPAPTSSASASASPTPHRHQSSKPRHSSSPSPNKHGHAHAHRSHSPRPHATGFKLPPLPPLPSVGKSALPKGSSPVVAPGLASPAPVTTTSSTPVAAVVAGPLETAEDTSRGLPIAVAVLVVLGLASGYGRVLLATPRPAAARPEQTAGKRRDGSVDTRRDGSVDKRRDGDHRV